MLIDSKIKILPEIKGKLENYYGVSVQEVLIRESVCDFHYNTNKLPRLLMCLGINIHCFYIL